MDFKKTMDKAIRSCDSNPEYKIEYIDMKTMKKVKTEYFNNKQDAKRRWDERLKKENVAKGLIERLYYYDNNLEKYVHQMWMN